MTELNIENAKTLAKISKRLEELKAKLEGGQLKVDDLADSGVEYKVLKKAYEKLLYADDMVGSLVKDGCTAVGDGDKRLRRRTS